MQTYYYYKCVNEDLPVLWLLWNKDIDYSVKYNEDGNERINVLFFTLKENPICLINVYMPSENDNGDDKYKDIWSQLEEIIEKI